MKPLLKCPYPVDCWGREMRITLSILIAERINQLRKSRKLSVNKLWPLSTRIRSLLRLLYKRIKRTYLICWVYSAVSALKVSIEFFLFRIN